MPAVQSIGATSVGASITEQAGGDQSLQSGEIADTIVDIPSIANNETSLGLDAVFDPDVQWPDLLDFLNRRDAYSEDVEKSLSVRQSSSMLHHDDARRRHARCFWCWRRLHAVCRKPNSFDDVDPLEPFAGLRNAIGRVVMSPVVQSSVMFFILIDITVFLYKMVQHPDETFGFSSSADEELYSSSQLTTFLVVDWIVFCVIGAEVLARIAYYGNKFTHSMLNLLEVSLVPLMAFELLTRDGTDLGIPVPVLRACRPLIRSANLVAKAVRGFNHALHLRHVLQMRVAGTHKRFQQDGFNLDLCYITSQIIGMGRPAVGRDALFNNPLGEVARFFDARHPNRYIIVNVAEEGFNYPKRAFHQRVVRFPIPVHGVPKLSEIWKLCEAIKVFLDYDERNVCAVHAHACGGQVGIVIGACLLYSGAFRQATAAMSNYERTRTAAGAAETVQGFDCASQRRFIEYFCSCVHDVHAVPTPPIRARLERIRVIGLGVEALDGVNVRIFAGRGKNRTAALSRNWKSQDDLGEESAEESKQLTEDDEDEAVLLMIHEDAVLQLAEEEKNRMLGDALDAGCMPTKGTPFLDTAEDADYICKGKVVQLQGDEPLEIGASVGWKLEDVIIAGELCVEVHVREQRKKCTRVVTGSSQKSRPKAGVSMSKTISDKFRLSRNANPQIAEERSGSDSTSTETSFDSKLLFSAWFHTSFLRQSQCMNLNRELGDNTIGLTLGRFGVDKASGAPSLQTYGASFQMQLIFQVDDDVSHRPQDTVSRSRLEDEEEGKRVLKKLHPPGDTDVSDFYSIGWLTWCVQRLWPFTETALVRLMRESVEPLLQEAVPGPLKSIHFSSFTLGTATPELGPMVVSQRTGDSAGLQLDMILKYRGDANILMDAKLAKIGVNYVELIGTLSILFDPIVDNLPIIGGMKLFFLNPPVLHMKFVGLAELAHLPFLQRIVESTIQEALADILVLPNVLCLNWMPDLAETGEPSAYLTNKLPTGVLRVGMLEVDGIASELKFYMILKFGATTTKTSMSQRTAHPKWKETFDLLLYDLKQTLFVELWSHERGLKSDKMVAKSHGIEVGNLLRSERGLSWIVLDAHDTHLERGGSFMRKPVPKGTRQFASSRVHLHMELFTLMAERADLEMRITESVEGQAGNIALLVCDVKKGRVPEARLAGASVCVRAGSAAVERKCFKSDETWKMYADLSDVAVNTIEVLVREGFSAAKVAEILKQPEPLVNKVMAHCLGFNVDLPQHFCVLVAATCLSTGSVEIEIKRKGRVEAKCSVSCKEVVKATNMKYRRLLVCSAGPRQKSSDKAARTPESRQNRFDLDIELQLFALNPSQAMNASRMLQKLRTATSKANCLKSGNMDMAKVNSEDDGTSVCQQAENMLGQDAFSHKPQEKVLMYL